MCRVEVRDYSRRCRRPGRKSVRPLDQSPSSHVPLRVADRASPAPRRDADLLPWPKSCFPTTSFLTSISSATSSPALRVELVTAQCKSEDEVIAAAADCAGILLQYAPITERVVASLPGLGIVSRIGAGFDTIDTDACSRHGVWVANSPDYGVGEVATHALALALALTRATSSPTTATFTRASGTTSRPGPCGAWAT